MKIKKALITAAGFGTRFLPITKTIQKEMLPILNRPIIDYVVDDLVKAGVEEIVFVISEHNIQLLHYYRENKRLYNYLKRMGKVDLYERVANLHTKAKFTFIRQPDDAPYGTAVPVLFAKEHLVKEEAFFVFMGDDFLFNANGFSESQAMLKLFQASGASGVMACVKKPKSQISRYGVVKMREINGHRYLDSIVEKPPVEKAPSNLVNISKYILTPKIFEILDKQGPNPDSGELYITDTVTTLAQQEKVAIYTPKGYYLDGGNPAEWLKANLTVAYHQPEIWEKVKKHLDRLNSKF